MHIIWGILRNVKVCFLPRNTRMFLSLWQTKEQNAYCNGVSIDKITKWWYRRASSRLSIVRMCWWSICETSVYYKCHVIECFVRRYRDRRTIAARPYRRTRAQRATLIRHVITGNQHYVLHMRATCHYTSYHNALRVTRHPMQRPI